MEHRFLGRTGVPVSKLCLGTFMFGAWGNGDHGESIRIVHRALDAGIDFIDTADVYSDGESERIVSKALAGRRDEVFLATKFGFPLGQDPRRLGASRRRVFAAVEDSLRRLGTDWIDLYQLHRPDPHTEIEETLGALTDLVREGKIRYFGHTTFPASEIVEAQAAAERRGLERPRCEQPTYSVLTREIERDVLPTVQRHGLGAISYSPLSGGWLSGRYSRDATSEPLSDARSRERFDPSLEANRRKLEAVIALGALAEEAGISLIELSIAFVLRHPAITAAIIGPRTLEHLESQLPAADVQLGDDVLDRIDEIVAPGTTINPADHGWEPPSLGPAARRR